MDSIYQLPTPSHSARQALLARLLLFLVLDAVAASSVATQTLAHRLGYPPRFGPALLRAASYPSLPWALLAALAACALLALLFLRRARASLLLLPLPAILLAVSLGPLYPPLSWLRWQRWLRPYPAAAPALAVAERAFYVALAGFLLAALAATVSAIRRHRTTGDTHGSSRWARPDEIEAAGLLGEEPGVVAGAVDHGRRSRYLRDPSERHVLLFAPSGTGKSTCLVIPTLLEWPHSTIVLDIKGELWHRTAGYRRAALGQRCLRFDPSCADGTAARYNPLFGIPQTLEADKYAQALADVLIDPDGSLKARDFWQQSAHALLTGTVLHTLFAERRKTLAGCAHLLSDPERAARDTLEVLKATQHDPGQLLGWTDPRTGEPTTTHPTVAAAAASLLNLDWKTASGILATALSHLDLYRDPVVAANTETSDFTAEDLVDPAGPPVSLYLTIPPSDLSRLRGLIRLTLNQLVSRLTDRLDHEPDAPRRPLLLVLDEFTALGSLEFLARAIAYLRGYGVRVFISIQSLSQLYAVYGQHQSITSNCAVQVSYGANDIETAKLLSDMTGRSTVNLERPSVSGGAFGLGGRHTYAQTDTARPLLTPDEVRRLPRDQSLVFVAGYPPIRARRVPYFQDPEFTRRAAIPPPPTSDRLDHDWSLWTGWRAVLPPSSSDPGSGPPLDLDDLLRPNRP